MALGPRTNRGTECSHLRPVVKHGDMWLHVLDGVTQSQCHAGIYYVQNESSGHHYVTDMVPKENDG